MLTITYRRIAGLAIIALLYGCSEEQASSAPAAENMPVAGTPAPAPAQARDAAAAGPGTSRAQAVPHTGIVQGTVLDAAGQPLAGAFVKLDNPDRRLTFMVISQAGGRYTADRLPSGSYTVQGVGGDYQSDWSAPAAVANGTSVTVDVALDVERGPDLPAAWPRRVPDHMATLDSMPAGAGKDVIGRNCTGCHAASTIVTSRYDAETWSNTVADMQERMVGSGQPELSDADAAVLLDYLVANLAPLPPPDPNSRLPRHHMQDEAMQYRVVQYNLEQTGVETHDVAVDPSGVGWANQRTGGMISRFDPVTYEYSEIGPPLYTAKRARPGNLQISSEGIMWLADPFEKRWLSYDIANDKWTDWMFPMDRIRGQVQGNSLVLHHDGTIWMAGPGSARRLDPRTGEWSAWDTPTWKATQKNPGGYGITVAGDGRVWMAMNLVDKLARFDGKTGEVAEFDLEPGAYPRRMDYDNNGDVYIGLWGADKILKVDHKTDEMSIIEPPIRYNGAYSIDFDKSTNLLWVTFQTADYIARYNLDTGQWLMLPLPQAESDVRRIEVDQNRPNRVWWVTNAFNARIGYIELL